MYKRPTHFVSLRIKDDNIWSNISTIQEKMIKTHPKLEPYLVTKTEAHITLFVLELPQKDLEKAKKCILEAKDICKKLEKIKLSGIGDFNQKVLFAKIENDDNLKKFQSEITELFEKGGIKLKKENHGFNPHVTLFKLSKGGYNQEGLDKIPLESFEKHKEFSFGEFSFNSLELNKMRKYGGYYEYEIILDF